MIRKRKAVEWPLDWPVVVVEEEVAVGRKAEGRLALYSFRGGSALLEG